MGGHYEWRPGPAAASSNAAPNSNPWGRSWKESAAKGADYHAEAAAKGAVYHARGCRAGSRTWKKKGAANKASWKEKQAKKAKHQAKWTEDQSWPESPMAGSSSWSMSSFSSKDSFQTTMQDSLQPEKKIVAAAGRTAGQHIAKQKLWEGATKARSKSETMRKPSQNELVVARKEMRAKIAAIKAEFELKRGRSLGTGSGKAPSTRVRRAAKAKKKSGGAKAVPSPKGGSEESGRSSEPARQLPAVYGALVAIEQFLQSCVDRASEDSLPKSSEVAEAMQSGGATPAGSPLKQQPAVGEETVGEMLPSGRLRASSASISPPKPESVVWPSRSPSPVRRRKMHRRRPRSSSSSASSYSSSSSPQ
jgi:hypothetical protein